MARRVRRPSRGVAAGRAGGGSIDPADRQPLRHLLDDRSGVPRPSAAADLPARAVAQLPVALLLYQWAARQRTQRAPQHALDEESPLHRMSDAGPDDRAALRRHALDRVVAGAFAGALESLDRIGERLRDDPVVHLARAEATWGSVDVVAALPHFERALALDPTCLRTRARLGLALIDAGRAAEGQGQLETVIAALPSGGPVEAQAAPLAAPLAFAPAASDAALQLGQSLLALGQLERAIAALEHAAALAPSRAPARLALGGALALRGDHTAAIDLYRTAVGLDADCVLAWTVLAQALRQFGQVEEAETYATAAVSLTHDAAERDLILGNALLTAGHPAAARARFARVMAGLSWADTSRRAATARPDGRLRVGVIAAPGRANT